MLKFLNYSKKNSFNNLEIIAQDISRVEVEALISVLESN